ncbi:hypothetical protein B8W95_13045, partial [Staphylococcus pasteuri]
RRSLLLQVATCACEGGTLVGFDFARLTCGFAGLSESARAREAQADCNQFRRGRGATSPR